MSPRRCERRVSFGGADHIQAIHSNCPILRSEKLLVQPRKKTSDGWKINIYKMKELIVHVVVWEHLWDFECSQQFPKVPNGVPRKLSWREAFTMPQWHDTLMKLFSVGDGAYKPYPTGIHLHSGEYCPYAHQNLVDERPSWESDHAMGVFVTLCDFTLAMWIHNHGQRQRHVHDCSCGCMRTFVRF